MNYFPETQITFYKHRLIQSNCLVLLLLSVLSTRQTQIRYFSLGIVPRQAKEKHHHTLTVVLQVLIPRTVKYGLSTKYISIHLADALSC